MFKRKSSLIGLLALFSLLSGIIYSIYHDIANQTPAQELHATVFNTARVIAPFTLINDQGQKFTNADLQKKWSLLFFGFTRCDSICPTTLAELAKVSLQLAKLPQDQQPHILFITVDPEFDTPERLRQYLDHFNPAFTGLTGPIDELAAIRSQLGILAMHSPAHHEQHAADNIDHSGTILLINPQGHYYGVFSAPHAAEIISKDLRQIFTQANIGK